MVKVLNPESSSGRPDLKARVQLMVADDLKSIHKIEPRLHSEPGPALKPDSARPKNRQ
jgi:hypothetical protein